MTRFNFTIREIRPQDNKAIATLIRNVLVEFDAPKTGTAYEDKATDAMFEAYDNPQSSYFIIERDKQIFGGAGFASLEGNICELQKMYFTPHIRGKGLGNVLIQHCLKEAKNRGYTQCYLETMPYMQAARALYKNNGFKELNAPIGNTGHYSCNVWMIKKL